MLVELRLKSFRCFEEHAIPFRPTTIVVGRNNAGKSTIVEALRLVSVVENRYQGLNFSPVPDWLEAPAKFRGVRPSLSGIDIAPDSLFHNYRGPPSELTAVFNSGEQIKVYVGPEADVFGVILDRNGNPIVNKRQAQDVHLPDIAILPQIRPLPLQERILREDYVRRAVTTNLSSLHFRNQLNLFYQHYPTFKAMAEETWPTLRVVELTGKGEAEDRMLGLLMRDGGFVAEVGLMGHGLQMWLQTIWFLARTPSTTSVILDEPDVYMHPDLQRKLIRVLRGRYQQCVIATHSVEIMAEASPSDVLIVDRRQKVSTYAGDLPGVQQVVDHIGGVHNLQLARLWNSKRCLLVEGRDLSLLRSWHDRLYPTAEESLDSIPHASIGGWGGWNYAVGSALILKNSVGEAIMTYCIFDSDYHTRAEIDNRLADAQKRNVQLHIWKMKEIENYLLVPNAIARVIAASCRGKPPSSSEVAQQINTIADSLRDQVFDSIATELHLLDKAGGPTTANRAARQAVDQAWKSREGKWSIISGKVAIARLSGWSQKTYGTSLNSKRIADELKRDEIAAEVQSVLEAIEKGRPFTSASPPIGNR